MDFDAVVDLGTNSARLMIATADGGVVKSVYKTLRMVRIGEGMVETGCISEAAMQRTQDALAEFLDIAEQYGARDRFFCFATSAVREAENRQVFADRIKGRLGIDIDIISGDREAVLGFAGSVDGYGGMFDIGGGSTEVMAGRLGDIAFSRSFKIGTVRCLQMFPTADDADPDAFLKAHALAAKTFTGVPKADGFVYTGIGGSATALAALDLGLEEYAAERVQGHKISLKRAQELGTMLESKTKQQRKALIGLEEKRADVIVFGAIICLEFMKAAGADAIVVSDRDNQEGYLAMKKSFIVIPAL